MGRYLSHAVLNRYIQSACRADVPNSSAGFVFGIGTGTETLQMLTVAFVVFIIPHIAEWLFIRITAINYGLREFIKS